MLDKEYTHPIFQPDLGGQYIPMVAEAPTLNDFRRVFTTDTGVRLRERQHSAKWYERFRNVVINAAGLAIEASDDCLKSYIVQPAGTHSYVPNSLKADTTHRALSYSYQSTAGGAIRTTIDRRQSSIKEFLERDPITIYYVLLNTAGNIIQNDSYHLGDHTDVDTANLAAATLALRETAQEIYDIAQPRSIYPGRVRALA